MKNEKNCSLSYWSSRGGIAMALLLLVMAFPITSRAQTYADENAASIACKEFVLSYCSTTGDCTTFLDKVGSSFKVRPKGSFPGNPNCTRQAKYKCRQKNKIGKVRATMKVCVKQEVEVTHTTISSESSSSSSSSSVDSDFHCHVEGSIGKCRRVCCDMDKNQCIVWIRKRTDKSSCEDDVDGFLSENNCNSYRLVYRYDDQGDVIVDDGGRVSIEVTDDNADDGTCATVIVGRHCLTKEEYEEIVSSSDDCPDGTCNKNSNSVHWTFGAAAMIGAIANPLAYYASNKAYADAQLGGQEAWAASATAGYEQCQIGIDNYLTHVYNTEAPTVTPDQFNSFQCKGYGQGGYTGMGQMSGMMGTGYGGYGNSYMGAGYTSGMMSGMSGQYGMYNPYGGMSANMGGYPGYGGGIQVGGVLGNTIGALASGQPLIGVGTYGGYGGSSMGGSYYGGNTGYSGYGNTGYSGYGNTGGYYGGNMGGSYVGNMGGNIGGGYYNGNMNNGGSYWNNSGGWDQRQNAYQYGMSQGYMSQLRNQYYPGSMYGQSSGYGWQ